MKFYLIQNFILSIILTIELVSSNENLPVRSSLKNNHLKNTTNEEPEELFNEDSEDLINNIEEYDVNNNAFNLENTKRKNNEEPIEDADDVKLNYDDEDNENYNNKYLIYSKNINKNDENSNDLNANFVETRTKLFTKLLTRNYNENYSLNLMRSNSPDNSNSNSSPAQSGPSYFKRILKMRKKRAYIICKVFDKTPFIAEILTLSAVEKIGLILSPEFLQVEKNIVERYLIMLEIPSRMLSNSSKLLLNSLLCNWKNNSLRKLLMEITDGLCKGDDNSIVIYKEIVTSVLIDYLLKSQLYYQNDIEARLALVNVFNSLIMKYEPIIKIEFVNKYLQVSDALKEKLTMLILDLYPQEKGKAILY